MPTGPFQGPEVLARISNLQLSRLAGNNTTETREREGAGLPPHLSPAFSPNKASPWCLRLHHSLATHQV